MHFDKTDFEDNESKMNNEQNFDARELLLESTKQSRTPPLPQDRAHEAYSPDLYEWDATDDYLTQLVDIDADDMEFLINNNDSDHFDTD